MFDERNGRVPSGWLPKGEPPSPKRVEEAVRRGEVVRLPPAMFERSKPGGGWEASPPRVEAWPRREGYPARWTVTVAGHSNIVTQRGDGWVCSCGCEGCEDVRLVRESLEREVG